MRELTPATIRAAFARYAHGVEIPAGWRIVQTSGQLGIRMDDHVPHDARAQADICFANIEAILDGAGMTRGDIAHLTGYVTDRSHMAAYMSARDDFLSDVDRLPTSTLLVVSGFTRPEFKVEVEAMAAAPES